MASPTTASIEPEGSNYGEVFTRRWVVELILEVAGYRSDLDLASLVAVEPSCGSGAFLGPMVERLSKSLRGCGETLDDASAALRAYDLQEANVEASRALVAKTLADDGWEVSEAVAAAERWISCADYLLASHAEGFADLVVGNPPYIRWDDIDADTALEYRRRCPTMGGRADIYIGFFEVGLRSLRDGGALAFICADRWMRNQYGTKLRAMLTDGYSVETTVLAHDVDAFEEQVSAYPAITVIRRAPQGPSVIANTTSEFGEAEARQFFTWFETKRSKPLHARGLSAATLPHWFGGEASWPMGSPERLATLEYLNDNFGPLEDRERGTRIGIGVATGADQVFVVKGVADVEPDRLLPMAMGRDTVTGEMVWSGHYLINPWAADGSLVPLDDYPRMAAYFEQHEKVVSRRNVAERRPEQWYRTIDKVEHALTARPKLMFPDMKMTSHPVLDRGGFYPHHGLYFIVSDEWDLEVLGGLLLSKVAEFFIDCYAVKMRGGTMRFQAQYLRRIRVPRPGEIDKATAKKLSSAFLARDVASATDAALSLYGIEGIPD